jgi:PEP-CTERM motif
LNIQQLRPRSIRKTAISWQSIFVAALMVCAAVSLSPVKAQAGVVGPILPYFGPAQSPFNPASFANFYYDDFETGALSVPGVTLSPGVSFPTGSLVDSVEGPGPLGHTAFANGSTGITFTFDAGVLGSLPTAAGIVWTDGDGPSRHFIAYDQNNNVIGSIDDSTPLFFSQGGDDQLDNYRFFGATNAGGISKIFISNDSGGIEVDDLQFGVGPRATTPEPASLLLLGSGMVGLGLLRKRKK